MLRQLFYRSACDGQKKLIGERAGGRSNDSRFVPWSHTMSSLLMFEISSRKFLSILMKKNSPLKS